MLLRAEDQAKFQGRIDDKGATVWASYRIEGRRENPSCKATSECSHPNRKRERGWWVRPRSEGSRILSLRFTPAA